MKDIKLVATDLDGTFLKDNRTISSGNMEALYLLGERKILRAVATGRNLRKVREVLNEHVPFDYIVYSSGAGVYDWKFKRHLFNQNIKKKTAHKLMDHFYKKAWNFHAFFPTPENHKHWYFRGGTFCEEFERYFQFNNAFATELSVNEFPDSDVCQFLIIIKEDVEKFMKIKMAIEEISDEIRVVRTSSPITPGFIWIEIFHNSVSKGNGINKICEIHGIKQKDTVGIGNDYNDFDLLDFTGISYITGNAPPDIKNKYKIAPTNENDAFAFVIKPLIK